MTRQELRQGLKAILEKRKERIEALRCKNCMRLNKEFWCCGDIEAESLYKENCNKYMAFWTQI